MASEAEGCTTTKLAAATNTIESSRVNLDFKVVEQQPLRLKAQTPIPNQRTSTATGSLASYWGFSEGFQSKKYQTSKTIPMSRYLEKPQFLTPFHRYAAYLMCVHKSVTY